MSGIVKTRTQMVQTMQCAYCGSVKSWQDGFPSRIYAQCWPCFWKEHQRQEHPHKERTLRRLLRRVRPSPSAASDPVVDGEPSAQRGES